MISSEHFELAKNVLAQLCMKVGVPDEEIYIYHDDDIFILGKLNILVPMYVMVQCAYYSNAYKEVMDYLWLERLAIGANQHKDPIVDIVALRTLPLYEESQQIEIVPLEHQDGIRKRPSQIEKDKVLIVPN